MLILEGKFINKTFYYLYKVFMGNTHEINITHTNHYVINNMKYLTVNHINEAITELCSLPYDKLLKLDNNTDILTACVNVIYIESLLKLLVEDYRYIIYNVFVEIDKPNYYDDDDQTFLFELTNSVINQDIKLIQYIVNDIYKILIKTIFSMVNIIFIIIIIYNICCKLIKRYIMSN